MPNDILQDIRNECANLNKRTKNAYADLFAMLPQACLDHPDNPDLFQTLISLPLISEQFAPRYSSGVLQFLKALDSHLTVPLYMHLIPELIDLSYTQKSPGKEENLYSIYFFEILSYCFSNDQILQILADLNQCLPLVPLGFHGNLLQAMCVTIRFPLFSVDRPQAFAAVMSRRLHNLTAYLTQAHNQPSLYNLGLIPTGSDPHMGGKQALFLAIDSAQDPTPFLHKPRSMHPDFAVTEALALANETALTLHVADPTFAFFPLPIPAVSVNSRMVTFISRCNTFNPEQAALYYTQMGELLCLAHFFGITDLHQDNLIPAAEGPQIADAECAFDQAVMESPKVFETRLSMALTEHVAPEGVANAVFEIETQGYSTKHYREYAPQILLGYDAALKVCTSMVATSLPLLYNIEHLIDQIRIVPFTTAVLNNCFYIFHAFGAALQPDTLINDSELECAVQALANDCLVEHQTTLALSALCDAMNHSFENGDLPYFSVRRQPMPKDFPISASFLPENTTAGYLYCDNTLIGRCMRFGPPSNFEEALLQLTACRAQLQQWLIPASPADAPVSPDTSVNEKTEKAVSKATPKSAAVQSEKTAAPKKSAGKQT